MQQLYFEPAWDKTIAQTDRDKISQLFKRQLIQLGNDICFSFLWEAFNHRGERLVTVLIHNTEDNSLRIQDTAIALYKQQQQIANGIFHLPCEIPSKTSMPWTLIFSATNQTSKTPEYKITQTI